MAADRPVLYDLNESESLDIKSRVQNRGKMKEKFGERFESVLLNNVREAMVAWDTAGTIIYWNPAAFLLYGWSPGECLGKSVEEAYFPLFNPQIIPPGPENTAGQDIERICMTRAGREIWVSGRTTALRETVGARRIIGYMDLARDVSDRVRMMDRLHSMYLQLSEQRRLAAVGELAASVAHQINNPLTAILAEAQLGLRDPGLDVDLRPAFEAIEQAGWRAQQVVDTLLQYSKPGDDTLQEVSIRNTLDRALTLVGASFAIDHVELKISCPGGNRLVRANPNQLVNLWVNLLLSTRALFQNGCDHTVLVDVIDEGSAVRIEMLVSGVKALADEAAALLEPGMSPPGYGSGMELSICREIARQNHGSLTAKTIDRDILFRIEFPAEV